MKSKLLILFIFITSTNVYTQKLVGLSLGSTTAKGDVDYNFKYANSVGINYKTFLFDNISCEGELTFASLSGLDDNVWLSGLVESVYNGLLDNPIQPTYINRIFIVDSGLSYAHFLIESKLELSFGGGIGFSYSDVNVDIKDENDAYYNNTIGYTLINQINSIWRPNTVYEIYDGTYETNFDEIIAFHGFIMYSLSYSISNQYSVGVNIKNRFTTSDYLDAIKWRTAETETKNNDSLLSIRLTLYKYL